MIIEKIVIKAPPETVFEAIRKQRVSRRHTVESYDGTIAVVKESMEGIPVYGNVECIWQETESPYSRIDFKMLSSTKFKESYGAFILVPSNDGQSTTLELQAHMDAGLNIPFAAEMTKASTVKDSKLRLEKIKKVAEEDHKAK